MSKKKNNQKNTYKTTGRKAGLDERQQQIVDRTGTISCYIMLGVALVAILGQLLWTGEVTAVLGETVIFLTGGIAYLVGNIRNGIWDMGGKKRSNFRNILESVLFSGIFTVLFAIVIMGKAKEEAEIAYFAVLFFFGISLLCFFSLTFLEKAAERRKAKQEQKYTDKEDASWKKENLSK